MTVERKKKPEPPAPEAPVDPYVVFSLRGVQVVLPITPQRNPTRTIQIARAELHEIADQAEVVLHVAE